MSDKDNGGATDNGQGQGAKTYTEAEYNAVVAERDKAKRDAREFDQDRSEVRRLRSENADLITKTSNLQTEFDNFKQSVKTAAIEREVSTALDAAGAIKPDRAKGFLDLTKVEFDDKGQVRPESVTKLVNGLKESDPYMFKPPAANGEQGKDKKDQGGNTTEQQRQLDRPAAQGADPKGLREALEAARKEKDPFAAISRVMKEFKVDHTAA